MKKNEKYSEKFCNKENEVASGIFNSENWGKRTKIMTLKDKFINILHNWIDKDYDREHVSVLLEIDSDDYAIEILESYHNSLFIIPLKEGEAKRIVEHLKKEKKL